ncbi:kinase-like protein [Ceratobasidium sp. AG-I]|nr:kinase-like protein [Ceratobasidium sp. AG-I]
MAQYGSGFFSSGANPQQSTPNTFVPTLWHHYNHIESSIENGPEIDRNQCKVLLDQLKLITEAADRCAQRGLGALEIQQLNSNYFLGRRNQDWPNIIYQRRAFNQSLAPFVSELDGILTRVEGLLRGGRFRRTLELIEAARKVDDQSMDDFSRELNNISRGAYGRAYEAQDSAQLKTLAENVLQGQSSFLSLDQELQDEAVQNAKRLTEWIMKITKVKPKGNVILGRRLTGDWIHQVSTDQYEIYKTRFVSGEEVVIKMLRNRLVDEDIATRLAQQRFQRHIDIWCDLRYDHILPLYGIGMKTESSGENFVYCVSPFMRNGDAVAYMEANSPPVQQRLKIVKEFISTIVLHVANALRYLHDKDEPIVRFNVCSQNVLIDDDGRGVLGGMGFSKALRSRKQPRQTVFQAPEYHQDPDCSRKTSADVWSWAMVALQLVGGRAPFHEVRGGYRLISSMIEGGRPDRNLYDGIKELVEAELFWRLLEDCWAIDESERPTMDEVVRRTKKIMDKESQLGRRDPPVVPAPRPRRTEGSFSEPVDGQKNQGAVQSRGPSHQRD